MNRNNIWIHIGIAVVLVTMAAVLGQIGRWKTTLHENVIDKQERVEIVKKSLATAKNNRPEIAVRFKPGESLERTRDIASANTDTPPNKM